MFEFNIEYTTEYKYKLSKEIREIIRFLKYVPSAKITDLREKILKYKELNEKNY